ncbi:MAG: hypothetical protein HN576_06590 [Bacteriovoracaceae bacterium]|jgi:hypothetical protein|nr:hypothetical protein [Bacteriovoracaceae bacterium]
MKKGFNQYFKFLLVFLLSFSCATHKSRQQAANLKKTLLTGNVQKAIQLVESKKFYPEKRSRLLKLLELGTLKQINGDYFQSLKSFEKARELSDKLFTVSISKKALAAVTNNNMDNYYGEIYERSLIRFYIALNHYLIYQNGKYEAGYKFEKRKDKNGKDIIKKIIVPEKILSRNKKQFHLTAARAVMLEWDAALENYHAKLAGDTTYKSDLSSRIFGAFIHEQIGSRNDRTIALKLYQEAKEILFKNYNIYASFNGHFKKFMKDYEKLPKLSRKTVKTRYVKETHFAVDLNTFLNKRIQVLKSHKSKQLNITILTQEGYVAEKRARRIHVPLPGAAFHGSGNKGILSFTGMLLNSTKGTLPSITFELPEVANKKVNKDIELIIKDNTGKEVSRQKAVLMNPLSEIAFQSLDNKIGSTHVKIGARIALKHIAAIVAAWIAYKNAGKSLAGKFIASAMYATANKAIAVSEMADTRYWSTLPHSLRLSKLYLKPGQYGIYTKTFVNKKLSITKVKDFLVTKDPQQLINLNLY